MAYIRLPGKKKGFYRKCTLWLGEDHILAVDSNYYTENYKRFYFKDFQGLIVRETKRFSKLRLYTSISVLLALALLLFAIFNQHIGSAVFSGIALAGLTISLGIHLKRGPTCVCHLMMPLAVHELPSICRLKYARQVLERILPLVQRVQGPISADEIKSKLEGAVPSSHINLPTSGNKPRPGNLKEYSCFFHKLLFGTLLLDAAATLAQFYSIHWTIKTFNLIAGSAVFILSIATLVRQSGRSVPRMIKGLSWSVLAMLCASNIIGGMIGFFIGIQKSNVPQTDHLSVMLALDPSNEPLIATLFTYYIIASIFLGVWGLAATMMHASSAKKKVPVGSGESVPGAAEGAGL